jgi:hypothetical protein
MKRTYTYNPVEQLLVRSEKPDPTDPKFTVTTKIDLKKSTIQYNNDRPVALADDAFFTFLDFMKNIRATPELMNALLKNPYYTKQFLNSSLGIFNTPKENNFFQLFSSFLLPYEALYSELERKPKYAKKLVAVYDKNNSAFIRRLKQVTRKILIVPGIFISPFIILTSVLALNRWGKK